MITLEHIMIYKKYGGSDDAWAYVVLESEKQIFKGGEWSLINSLIQDILLLKKNLLSQKYIDELNLKLKENCDNEETIEALKQLALTLQS